MLVNSLLGNSVHANSSRNQFNSLTDFKHIAVVNADNILPEVASLFDMKGNLNGKGLSELWFYIDQTLKAVDKPSLALMQPSPAPGDLNVSDKLAKNTKVNAVKFCKYD